MSDPRVLKFQLGLGSESLNLLAKDDLRFIYQDSTGMRNDGVISSNELDKTKKPEYIVEIKLIVYLPDNPQNITWFSLHILNKYRAGRVDMRWDFKKDKKYYKKNNLNNNFDYRHLNNNLGDRHHNLITNKGSKLSKERSKMSKIQESRPDPRN